MPSEVAKIELPELDVTEEDRTTAWEVRRKADEQNPDRKYLLLVIETEAANKACRELQLLEALTQLSALREASEWVEISEGGLPEPLTDVLVSSKDWNIVTGANFIGGKWFDRSGIAWSDLYTDNPYRWRPTGSQPQPASAGKDK